MKHDGEVVYNKEDDEYYLTTNAFHELGWKPGTNVQWIDNENGTWTLRKKEMNYQNDVEQFMAAADQYIGDVPHIDENNEEQAKLYIDLIDEEFKELCDGFIRRHIGDIADGGADLVWVVQGLFTTLGINFDAVWEEVKNSNMSKVSDNGKILKREDGKVLKPDTYFKPDIDQVLKDQGYEG